MVRGTTENAEPDYGMIRSIKASAVRVSAETELFIRKSVKDSHRVSYPWF
jgi:hypothetical protein